MTSLLLKNCMLLDPLWDNPIKSDILLKDGVIKKIASEIIPENEQVFDCLNKIVAPGFIDLHCHIFESLHDVEKALDSGTRAAVKGGFTTLCAMSDSNPPLDNEGMIGIIKLLSKQLGRANVIPSACSTSGLKGEAMAEIGGLINAGAGLICDPGRSIKDTVFLRMLLEYTKMFTQPLFLFCEDSILSKDAQINEGAVSTRLGLVGNPSVSEDIIAARDTLMAEYLNAKIHISHVSTKGTVNIIREAKKRGVKVTCSITPHHMDLTEDCIKDFDSNFKVTPPLRTEEDRLSLIEGLIDGTIDAISTDHTPCSAHSKSLEFANAPSGIIGLETAFHVVYKRIVLDKKAPLNLLLQKFITGPAKILNIDKGSIKEGMPADLCIIDTNKKVEITKEYIVSKSKNTPYIGEIFQGAIIATLVGGVMKYFDKNFY